MPMATLILGANGYPPILFFAHSTQALHNGKGYCPEIVDLRLPLQTPAGIVPLIISCSWFFEHLHAKDPMLNVLANFIHFW